MAVVVFVVSAVFDLVVVSVVIVVYVSWGCCNWRGGYCWCDSCGYCVGDVCRACRAGCVSCHGDRHASCCDGCCSSRWVLLLSVVLSLL